MVPVVSYQKKEENSFTTDEMVSKLEAFANHRLDVLYLTKIMRT